MSINNYPAWLGWEGYESLTEQWLLEHDSRLYAAGDLSCSSRLGGVKNHEVTETSNIPEEAVIKHLSLSPAFNELTPDLEAQRQLEQSRNLLAGEVFRYNDSRRQCAERAALPISKYCLVVFIEDTARPVEKSPGEKKPQHKCESTSSLPQKRQQSQESTTSSIEKRKALSEKTEMELLNHHVNAEKAIEWSLREAFETYFKHLDDTGRPVDGRVLEVLRKFMKFAKGKNILQEDGEDDRQIPEQYFDAGGNDEAEEDFVFALRNYHWWKMNIFEGHHPRFVFMDARELIDRAEMDGKEVTEKDGEPAVVFRILA